MSANPLVMLAASMRDALSATLETATTDQAGRTTRLDIIDMIPDLKRVLTGDRNTIRDMTWSVRYQLATLLSPLLTWTFIALEIRHSAGN